MLTSSTAILLFSRSASAEARGKRFGLDLAASERITRQLISRTEATLARTGLPIFRSDETSQVGDTFGQRLAGSIECVYAAGFEHVLVVGNDCPSILPSHLRAAAQMLQEGKNVLGPDQRGGAWLIGLQRRDFDAGAFAALRWETAHLHDDLAANFSAFTALPQLGDLNTLENLRQNWHFLRTLLAVLADLLQPDTSVFTAPFLRHDRTLIYHRLGRAPPFLAGSH